MSGKYRWCGWYRTVILFKVGQEYLNKKIIVKGKRRSHTDI